MSNTTLGVPEEIIVQYTPKPYSTYEGPYIARTGDHTEAGEESLHPTPEASSPSFVGGVGSMSHFTSLNLKPSLLQVVAMVLMGKAHHCSGFGSHISSC